MRIVRQLETKRLRINLQFRLQCQHGLRRPRLRPEHHRPYLPRRGRRWGDHRRACGLPGPGRIRPPLSGRTPSELADDLLYQLGALQSLAGAAGAAGAAGGEVRYVKSHGALYNTIVQHDVHAQAVVEAVRSFSPDLPLLPLPGSIALAKADAAGLRGVAEAFADRAYHADGTLVSRREAGAVINDQDAGLGNMVRLAQTAKITAIDGSIIPIDADSICVHSDTPGSVAMAAAVRSGLGSAGITVRSFA